MNPSPQDFRSTENTHRIGSASARPAANTVLVGTLYFSTDTFSLERSNGTIWQAFSLPGNLAASQLLGRNSVSAGAVEPITLSPSLIMTGTNLTVRSGIFDYTYNSTTTAPPTASQVRMNGSSPFSTVTKVWPRFVSADGQDLYWGIMIIPTGSTLLIQDQDDHTRYVRFVTTGAPTDLTTYAEIPVNWVSSGLAILTAQNVFIRVTAS